MPNDRGRNCAGVYRQLDGRYDGGRTREQSDGQIQTESDFEKRERERQRGNGSLRQQPEARDCGRQIVEVAHFYRAGKNEQRSQKNTENGNCGLRATSGVAAGTVRA